MVPKMSGTRGAISAERHVGGSAGEYTGWCTEAWWEPSTMVLVSVSVSTAKRLSPDEIPALNDE